MIDEKTQTFIRQHVDDDVRQLALKGCRDADIDLSQALQQIAGRQKARQKVPTWAAIDDIEYPPHINMEQCSSEQTARYKAEIAGGGDSMADLTGGFGVDFWAISSGFRHATYIEQDETLCAIAEHNFRTLGLSCHVCRGRASTLLSALPLTDLVFIDPARRDEHGRRTFSIADCSPNVLELMPLLRKKARRLLIKLSPMLDWRKTVEDLGGQCEVHIVSVNNDCKELLIYSSLTAPGKGVKQCVVHCINILSSGGRQSFCFTTKAEQTIPLPVAERLREGHFLFEPNSSIMKGGCFHEVAKTYNISQLADNSHLFVGVQDIADYPGRRFQITAISSMNKREMKATLQDIETANIAVRNFPMSADELRSRLKLRNGGDCYIFATTLATGEHKLFICRKIG